MAPAWKRGNAISKTEAWVEVRARPALTSRREQKQSPERERRVRWESESLGAVRARAGAATRAELCLLVGLARCWNPTGRNATASRPVACALGSDSVWRGSADGLRVDRLSAWQVAALDGMGQKVVGLEETRAKRGLPSTPRSLLIALPRFRTDLGHAVPWDRSRVGS